MIHCASLCLSFLVFLLDLATLMIGLAGSEVKKVLTSNNGALRQYVLSRAGLGMSGDPGIALYSMP